MTWPKKELPWGKEKRGGSHGVGLKREIKAIPISRQKEKKKSRISSNERRNNPTVWKGAPKRGHAKSSKLGQTPVSQTKREKVSYHMRGGNWFDIGKE